MNIIKRLAKWTGILLAALIAIGLAWPWTTVLKERLSSGEFTEYLAENTQPLDLSKADGDFSFPDSFYENKLFLLGEIHGTQTAQDIDLAMMIHLNEKVGLSWLMAELSPVQAERFNAFLETGDEAYLAPVFDAWLAESAQWANQQHYEKIIALRDYNMQQPEDRRIRYFGVDLIRSDQQQDAVRWLDGLLLELPEDVPAEMSRLQQATSGPFDAEQLRSAIEAALPILQDEMSESASTELAKIHYIARNLLASLDDLGRYDVIPGNITSMVEEFGIGDNEPVYGFWGIFHVMKAKVQGSSPLALQLTQGDLPFAKDIASVLMVYADSSQNMPSRALPSFLQGEGAYTEFTMSQDNPYLSYLYGIGDLKRMTDAPATLFHPFEEGSPYFDSDRLKGQSGLLTLVFPFEIENSEEPPVDHVILVDGSPALTVWDGQPE